MPREALAANGTVRGVFFSLGTTPSTDPQLDCAKAIIDLFNQAQKTAHVAIFTLTEAGIINAMIAAHKRGVAVSVVADNGQSQSANNPADRKSVV
jgi:phosphatidylserine/phosphatidylglycerophosphate/cardiolipin synthase-like enzyme